MRATTATATAATAVPGARPRGDFWDGAMWLPYMGMVLITITRIGSARDEWQLSGPQGQSCLEHTSSSDNILGAWSVALSGHFEDGRNPL